MYQSGNTSTDKFGEGTQIWSKLDCAAIKPDDVNNLPSHSNVRHSGGVTEIMAYYTDAGIDSLVSDGADAYQTGIATGDTSGTVKKNNISTCCCPNLNGEGVKVMSHVADGDSGGPIYKFGSEGNIVVLATAARGVNDIGQNECYGWGDIYNVVKGGAFHAMNDSMGLKFY